MARLTQTPAVNHHRRVTAQSATMMNSVMGVFSRGPFEAYWMKPWKASKVPAVTSPAALDRKRSRPSR